MLLIGIFSQLGVSWELIVFKGLPLEPRRFCP
uniref:Uncharacterized protein n=1 Tax=Anguilla anguilla TaxID=7936 RepID=A0A0E9XYK4_ANGAN